jgi:hypothetical protein
MALRAKRVGWLSVYAFHERKGGAERHRWRVYGSDGLVLARSAQSFATHTATENDARRVAGLLTSVFDRMDRRHAA